MKLFTRIAVVSFLVCFSSLAAFSQARSIKSVADDAVYHSADDGFNISLPADVVQKKSLSEAGKTGRSYFWEFSDAVIGVGVEVRPKPVKTETDVAAAVASYKATIPKTDKILSESPASIGEYRGKSLVVESEGNKELIIVLFWDKFGVTLYGSSVSKSPEIQKLVLEAVQSFEFVN